MTISQLSEKTGLSSHTLRYYEKIGIIRDIEKDCGKRFYSRQDVLWVEFIVRLKKTGMPLREIKTYARLRYEGDNTISERKLMLINHKARLKNEIKKLRESLSALETKIETYTKMEVKNGQI